MEHRHMCKFCYCFTYIIFTERFLSFVAGTRLTCCRTSEPTSEAAWMEKQPSLVKKNRSQRRSALTAFIAHILDFSTGAGSTILQNFSGSQDGWKTGRIQALQPQEVTNGQSYGSSNMFGTLTQGFKICFNTVCSIYNRPKLIKQSNFGWFHGTPSWWNSHIYIIIYVYILHWLVISIAASQPERWESTLILMRHCPFPPRWRLGMCKVFL